LPLTDEERPTAVLHNELGGHTPGRQHPAVEWLYRELQASPKGSLHLSDACRELRIRFPQCDPDDVVCELLYYPLANVYLTWLQDGRLVYDGCCRPASLTLPVGQDPTRPGFDFSDWMYNSRPVSPIPAAVS
jgi:hypothetical protein